MRKAVRPANGQQALPIAVMVTVAVIVALIIVAVIDFGQWEGSCAAAGGQVVEQIDSVPDSDVPLYSYHCLRNGAEIIIK